MKAIGFFEGKNIEDEESFIDIEIDKPVASGHDVLVQVKAVSINPVDVKIRQSTLKQNSPKIIGYDAVGIVVGVGEEATKFNLGDRIYYAGSTKRAGSHQEFQLVDERIAALAPKSLSDVEAAALPLTSLVSFELLFEKFGVIPKKDQNIGKDILVINGAGGVGSIFNQLAKWSGLEVSATADPSSFDWLKKNGVDHPIDFHNNLREELLKYDKKGVDYIAVLFDITMYFDQLVEIINPLGHIGTIVGIKDKVDIDKLKNLSVSFDWDYMFTKTDYQVKLESQGEALQLISNLVDSGDLNNTVGKIFDDGINATNIKEATKLVETGKARGKVIVTGSFNG